MPKHPTTLKHTRAKQNNKYFTGIGKDIKMKHKIISCFAILTLLSSLFVVNTSAHEGITIYVNEQILQCDPAPYIENGRTMVPMRKIFEALNAEVDWDGTTQTITARKDSTVYKSR